jgi:hypothetical protein
MAVYTIDEVAVLGGGKSGRQAFPKALKTALIKRDGEVCGLCGGKFPGRALQIDHKIPYEIGGDGEELDPADFMLVCGSCNRSKSWSCEHCPNWTTKNIVTCLTCMWSSPQTYTHVGTEQKRRLDLTWEGSEVQDFDKLAEQARSESHADVRVLVKRIVGKAVNNQE